MLNSTVHEDDYDGCDDNAVCHHAGGCDIGGCTCNHDIRYLMFNTITAASATAMMIMVVLVVR